MPSESLGALAIYDVHLATDRGITNTQAHLDLCIGSATHSAPRHCHPPCTCRKSLTVPLRVPTCIVTYGALRFLTLLRPSDHFPSNRIFLLLENFLIRRPRRFSYFLYRIAGEIYSISI